jgi:DNA-binding MarR family transcriptional regulator
VKYHHYMGVSTRIFDRLLEIALLFDADLERSFAGTALTASRTHLLWELHRLGPCTQRALATALQVSPRNVTGLVDALEAAGYVVRRPHPSDRRAILVTLTDQGVRTMAGMARDRERIAAQLVAGIGAGRLDELSRDLDLITERLHTLVERRDSQQRHPA